MKQTMKYAIWAYPWDLMDEGPANALDRLQTIGIDEVNLATNYHSVQTFHPHNPNRRTFFAHASSYFQPDGHYETLAPIPNERMEDDDWVEKIATAARGRDISLNSWTVGCHNSRLGMAHPETTLITPHGDSLVFGLCPSHPEVQAYLKNLITDLDDRGHFQRLGLETFDYFYGTGFGWHHDKYHTELGQLGEFLFGLCFCDHCRGIAHDKGVDVTAARRTCRNTIDTIAESELSSAIDVASWLQANPAVVDYIDARTATLHELYGEFADLTTAEIGYYAGHFDMADTWMHGVDLSSLHEMVDFCTALTYDSSRSDAVDGFNTLNQLTNDMPLHAGVLPGYPAIEQQETAENVVEGLVDAGAERIAFYNYGLLPSRNLDWIASIADEYR